MKNSPKISIVTIVYNGEESLEETISTVLNQTYDNIEFIIIDGGSKDGTVEIIKKYEDKIDYWISEPDKGISDAFNKGIAKSTGDYIQMLNSGDIFLENDSLYEAVKYFKNYEVVSFQSLTDTGNIFPNYSSEFSTNRDSSTIKEAVSNSMFSHQATFISKNVYSTIGMYSLIYKIRMDFDLFMKIQAEFDIHYVNKPIILYATDGMSSQLKNRLQFKREELQIIENYKSDFLFKILFYCKLPFYLLKKTLSALYYKLKEYPSRFSHGKFITILQYFTDRYDDYWHIIYPITDLKDKRDDKYLYFYDISRKALDYQGKFSDEGIYLFYGYDKKYHIHSLELSQYSLACWLSWRKTEDSSWLDKALLHCDWLVNNQEEDGAWRIEHKNPLYQDLPNRWPSGMAQGLAISSLLRAYMYSDKMIYLDAAKKACKFLQIDISDSGVLRNYKKNNIEGYIYEEYPRKELNGVLNGYITVVFALYELSQIDYSYEKIFSSNIENLKKILPLYDTGYWSYYALDGNIDSGFYHRYIVIQLLALEKIDTKFLYYRKLFEGYRDNKFFQLKSFVKKVSYKV